MNIEQVQKQIGTLKRRGRDLEPFEITHYGRVVLVCIPMADVHGPWAAIWRALVARIDTPEVKVPDLDTALNRLRWFRRNAKG